MRSHACIHPTQYRNIKHKIKVVCISKAVFSSPAGLHTVHCVVVGWGRDHPRGPLAVPL